MESYTDYDGIDSDVEARLYASVYYSESLLTEKSAVPESGNAPSSTDTNNSSNNPSITLLGSRGQRDTNDPRTGTNSPSENDHPQICEKQISTIANNPRNDLSTSPDNAGKSAGDVTSKKRQDQQVEKHESNRVGTFVADLRREVGSRSNRHRKSAAKHGTNPFDTERENQTRKSWINAKISRKRTMRSKQGGTNDARKKSSPPNNSVRGDGTVVDSFGKFSKKYMEAKSKRSTQYHKEICSNSSLFIMGLSSDSSNEDESIYAAADRQNQMKCKYRVKNVLAKNNVPEEIVLDDSDDNTNTRGKVSDSENSGDSIYEIPIPPKPKPPTIDLDDSKSSSDSDTDLENLTPEKLVQTYKEIAVQSLRSTPENATTVTAQIAMNCAQKDGDATTLATTNELRNRSKQLDVLPTNDENCETRTENRGSAVQSDIQMNINNPSKNAAQTMNLSVSSKEHVIVAQQDRSVAMARNTEEIAKLSQKESEVLEKELRREATSKTVAEPSSSSSSIVSKNPEKNINDNSNENETTNRQDLGYISVNHIHTSKDTSVSLNNEFITLQSTVSDSRKRSMASNESESKQQNPTKKSKISTDQVEPNITSSQSKERKKKTQKSSMDYFFKPMSEELKNFYNNSWGGETFDLNEIRKQMPQDNRYWIVPYTDFLHRQQQRYWIPGKCRNCQRPGHCKSMCPEKPKIPSCYMCGLPGHRETRCPYKICLNCGKPQHNYMKICSACRHTKCNICHAKGHVSDRCPDIWRRYHSTINSTDVNVPHRLSDVMKASHRLSCCNCTRRGHDSSSCKSLRWSQHFPTPSYVTSYTAGPAYPKVLHFDCTTSSSASEASNNEDRVDRNVEKSLGSSASGNMATSHEPAERCSANTSENNKSETLTIGNETEKLSPRNSLNARKSRPDQLFSNVANVTPERTNITELSRCITVDDENPRVVESNRSEQECVTEITIESPIALQVQQTMSNDIDINNRQIRITDRPGNSTAKNTEMLNYINIEESDEVSSYVAQGTSASLVLFSCQSVDFHLPVGKNSEYDVCSIPLFAKECDALIKCSSGQQFLQNLTSLPRIQIKIVRSHGASVVLSIQSHKSVHFPLQQIIIDWLNWPVDERNRFVQLNLPMERTHLKKLLMEKLDALSEDLGDPFDLCNEIHLLKNQLQIMQNRIKTGKTVGTSPKRDRVVDDLARSQCRLNMILFGQAELDGGRKSLRFLYKQLRRSKKRDREPLRTTLYLLTQHHFNKIFTAYTPPNLPQLLDQYANQPRRESFTRDTLKKPKGAKKPNKVKKLNRIKKPKKVKEDKYIKFVRDLHNVSECHVQSHQQT